MKFFTSHTLTLKKTVRLFQYFTSLTLWMHGVLHQSALQQQPLYKSPSMNVSGIYTALAMQTILYNESRGANLYSVTQNRCLPTDKLALTVTSNGEENKKTKKKPKPKCFLIGSLGDDVKGAALVMQVCSKTWDFYNGYICFCKTYCKDTYTVWWEIMQTCSQRAKSLVLMQLHSRLTSILLMLLPRLCYLGILHRSVQVGWGFAHCITSLMCVMESAQHFQWLRIARLLFS